MHQRLTVCYLPPGCLWNGTGEDLCSHTQSPWQTPPGEHKTGELTFIPLQTICQHGRTTFKRNVTFQHNKASYVYRICFLLLNNFIVWLVSFYCIPPLSCTQNGRLFVSIYNLKAASIWIYKNIYLNNKVQHFQSYKQIYLQSRHLG